MQYNNKASRSTWVHRRMDAIKTKGHTMPVAKQESSELHIRLLEFEQIEVAVIGERPLILNRLSDKTRRELLIPKGRRDMATRAATPKHDPIAEFRDSPYILTDDDEPTYLAHMASAFKGAMLSAAVHIPGVFRTQVGSLIWVEGTYVPVYGVPKLFMSPVRSADMKKTPDIHTRCIVPQWAASFVIRHSVPLIKRQAAVNLLANAGMISGVGDWRSEKGKGTYGQFRIVEHDDPAYQEIVATGGRDVQIAAMDDPAMYDDETAEMFSWFVDRPAPTRLRSAAAD